MNGHSQEYFDLMESIPEEEFDPTSLIDLEELNYMFSGEPDNTVEIPF